MISRSMLMLSEPERTRLYFNQVPFEALRTFSVMSGRYTPLYIARREIRRPPTDKRARFCSTGPGGAGKCKRVYGVARLKIDRRQ